jgi:uncharacterized membrane protein
MVVCSRCAGIYTGMVVGSVLARSMKNFPWFRGAVVFSAGLMCFEVLFQELKLYPPWHVSRFASGFLFSVFGVSWVVAMLIRESEKYLGPLPNPEKDKGRDVTG